MKRRFGSPRRSPVASDAGSVLIEVLVGISILATLTGVAARMHAGVIASQTAAHDRVHALLSAQWELEHHVLGLMDPLSTGAESSALPLKGDPCSEPGLGGLQVIVVRAFARSTGEEVALVGAPHASGAMLGAGSSGARAIVRLNPEPLLPLEVAHGPLGTAGTADGEKSQPCLATGLLAPGLHEVRIIGESGGAMVDRLHRTAMDAPHVIAVLDAPIRTTWDLSEGAQLGVSIDASGARLPDAVDPEPLRWLIRGDDARTVTAIGESRIVSPGRVTTVVSACANPETPASAKAVNLVAGEVKHVHVPMATVTVRNLEGRTDATLVLVRSTRCHDGRGVLPELRWHADLHEGMRIALPHGRWLGQLQSSSGQRLTAFVGFSAGEPGLVVDLP
jgi:hypothetical protein